MSWRRPRLAWLELFPAFVLLAGGIWVLSPENVAAAELQTATKPPPSEEEDDAVAELRPPEGRRARSDWVAPDERVRRGSRERWASADTPPKDAPGEDRDGPGGWERGGGRGGRDGWPSLWMRLTEQERQEIQEFIEERFPRMFVELQRIKDKQPQRFERRMSRAAPEILHMMEVMEVNPERGALEIQERQLDVEMRQLTARFRNSDGREKRQRLRERVRELCERTFDCRHQRQALEIRELEARLAELRHRLEESAAMREQLIAQEVKERLRESSGGGPEGNGRGRPPHDRRGEDRP